MIMLTKRLLGGYTVADPDGKPLALIKPKLFSPRFTIMTPQGDTVAYADICVHRPKDFATANLENTSYLLLCAQSGERLATGLPAYHEDVDGTKLPTYWRRPPLADRMAVLLQGMEDPFFLRVKMDGSAVISGIAKDVTGSVKRLKGGDFSAELSPREDTTLLCGIFLFTRYLLMENELIIV